MTLGWQSHVCVTRNLSLVGAAAFRAAGTALNGNSFVMAGLVPTTLVSRPDGQVVADRRFDLQGALHRVARHHALVMRHQPRKRRWVGVHSGDIAPKEPKQV